MMRHPGMKPELESWNSPGQQLAPGEVTRGAEQHDDMGEFRAYARGDLGHCRIPHARLGAAHSRAWGRQRE